MNIQPKMEPGSPSTTHIVLDRDDDDDETLLIESANNLQDKTIPDLVEVLRVAYLPKTFDDVEAVLLSKDLALRNQIQLSEHNVEMVRQQLQEEKLARLKAEEEVKKSERVCGDAKKLEQRYTTLLKELKRTDLASDRETIDVLRKRNIELKEMWVKENILVKKYEGLLKEAEVQIEPKKYEVLLKEVENKAEKEREAMEELKKKKIELECEVKQLNEKRVVDGKAFDVLKTTMVKLENQILELKGKKAEDDKSFDELMEKNRELKEMVNSNLEIISRLKNENSSLSEEKRNGEILLESLNIKFKELHERVAKMDDDTELLTSVVVSSGGKNDTVQAASLPNGVSKKTLKDNLATISRWKNENSSLAKEKRKGEILIKSLNMKFKQLHERVAKMDDDTELLMSVVVSGGGKNEFGNDTVQAAQPQNIRSKDAQDASSASGRLKMVKDTNDDDDYEVDDDDADDDDYDPCISRGRGAHEKTAISGIAAKNGHPTPSSVHMTKRKHSIAYTETSSSDSSFDLTYLNNLASRLLKSEQKKKKI